MKTGVMKVMVALWSVVCFPELLATSSTTETTFELCNNTSDALQITGSLCPEKWEQEGNDCFTDIGTRKTFSDGQALCYDRGGHLPILATTNTTENFQTYLARKKLDSNESVWIGLRLEGRNREFKWVDGSQLNESEGSGDNKSTALDSGLCVRWHGLTKENADCSSLNRIVCHRQPVTELSWDYRGCYKDIPDRIFANEISRTQSMSNQLCQSLCLQAGYTIAVTEYREHCYCGFMSGLVAQKVAEDDCSDPCPGEPDEICGGFWRMSVYNARPRDRLRFVSLICSTFVDSLLSARNCVKHFNQVQRNYEASSSICRTFGEEYGLQGELAGVTDLQSMPTDSSKKNSGVYRVGLKVEGDFCFGSKELPKDDEPSKCWNRQELKLRRSDVGGKCVTWDRALGELRSSPCDSPATQLCQISAASENTTQLTECSDAKVQGEETCSCEGGIWSNYTESCFILSRHRMSWKEGGEYCSRRGKPWGGGRLAFIYNTTYELISSLNGWIGLVSIKPGSRDISRDWRWDETDRNASYCVEWTPEKIFLSKWECGYSNGRAWFSHDCSNLRHALCELFIPVNDPVIPSKPTSCGPSLEPPFPLSDAEVIVAKVMISLGCTGLLIAVGLTIGLFFFLRDFSVERMLHMCQEVFLLAGHLLVFTMRDRVENPTVCKVTAFLLQYCFVAVFVFLFLEALQSYCILTNVISTGGVLSRKSFLLIGFISALVPTILTPFFIDQLVSQWSCWLNLGRDVALLTLVPIVLLFTASVVTLEATGMDEAEWPRLPDSDGCQRVAAKANSKALVFLLPLHFLSWFIGAQAVYYVNVGLYGTVSVLNLSLGIGIFFSHSLGNPKIHALFQRMKVWWQKKRRSGKEMSSLRSSLTSTATTRSAWL